MLHGEGVRDWLLLLLQLHQWLLLHQVKPRLQQQEAEEMPGTVAHQQEVWGQVHPVSSDNETNMLMSLNYF